MSNTYKDKAKGKRKKARLIWRYSDTYLPTTEYNKLLSVSDRRHVKHASDLVFCGCQQCNYGLHSGSGTVLVQRARASARNTWRTALHTIGDPEEFAPPPARTSVGFTD